MTTDTPRPASPATRLKLNGPARDAAAVQTIDATPTWSAMVPALLALLDNGTPEGRALARSELARMGGLADMGAAAIKAARTHEGTGDAARSNGPAFYRVAALSFDRAATVWAALGDDAGVTRCAMRADMAHADAPDSDALGMARAALSAFPLAEIMADTRPARLRATARDLRDALAGLVDDREGRTPAPARVTTLADLFAEEEEARAKAAARADGEAGQ